MRALLYDVHGNLPALEAVLADARAEGAESFVLGGDYAFMGAFPRETMEALCGLEAVWIRGNTERWAAGDEHDMPQNPLMTTGAAYCREQLGETATELSRLDQSMQLDGALICHASPHSDMELFPPEPSERDAELLRGTGEAVIVFGHTHLQFAREADGRLLVNPGSVGLPFDGDWCAAYALWRGEREFELRRVEYDRERYVAQVRERMGTTLGESIELPVRRIEQAAFVN